MTHRTSWLLPLLAAACSYDAPVHPDPPFDAELNALEGTVVFVGDDIGPAYVTVYDADNPGPPIGTGAPVTFSSVSPSSFGGGAGLNSAPFGVTQLIDGDYLVNALVDLDDNFSPFSDVLAGATCNDWIGTHVADLQTALPAVVALNSGEAKRDVTVLVSQRMTTNRPVFAFKDSPEISLSASARAVIPLTYTIEASAASAVFNEDISIDHGPACERDLDSDACGPVLACRPCLSGPDVNPCDNGITAWVVDADNDGEADPYPGELQAAAGIFNVFPRVFIEYIGEPLGEFRFEGQMFPERWVSENFPMAQEIGIEVLTGGSAAAIAPIGVPTKMQQISITVTPIFRHYHADGASAVDANGPYDLLDLRENASPEDVPTGRWRATLVSHTGQTWNVPNDIGAEGLPTLNGFDGNTQDEALILVP